MNPAIVAFAVLAMLPSFALAQDARRQAILSEYAAAAPQALSARRGEQLFRTAWSGGDARTPSCTSCHTADPRQAGHNAKTGRAIDPLAVSANAERLTDADTVAKHFARDCKSVLGRACTVQEQADFLAFMIER